MTSVDYEIISGKRRNSELLYIITEQQLYMKKTKYKTKQFYVCYSKECKSRAYVENNQCFKCRDADHNHGSQKFLYDEMKVMNTLKRECMDPNNLIGNVNALSGIRQKFQDVCSRNQDASKNIAFAKVKRGLQYLTNTVFVTSPKTPKEIIAAFNNETMFNSFGLTRHDGLEKTPFFRACFEVDDFSYCVFASEKIVSLIKENIPKVNTKILIDATFSVVPIGCFKQLLLVHVEYFEKVFPFIFILMNKKSFKCYAHLMKYINDNILQLDGAIFIADYEMGLRKAITSEFPNSKLFGCWFHFSQAVRRQVVMKYRQLATYIREDKNASLEYHKLLVLPLLPSSHIVSGFHHIKDTILKFDHHNKFTTFLGYYETQWIKKVGPLGISVFGTSTRTTSAIEAYNGVLGRTIPKHGNFFKFVSILLNEELSKSRELHLLINSGGAVGKSKRCRQSVDRSDKIEEAGKDLQSGKITASTFLNRLVFPKNKIFTEMEPDEDVFDEITYLEEENTETEDLADMQPVSSLSPICIVCLVAPPNILLIPCKHLKLCDECLLKLQADCIADGKLKCMCPVCRKDVDDYIQVYM